MNKAKINRKKVSLSIDKKLKEAFVIKCKSECDRQSDVINALLSKHYIKGD